jgi:hypothetical protein
MERGLKTATPDIVNLRGQGLKSVARLRSLVDY